LRIDGLVALPDPDITTENHFGLNPEGVSMSKLFVVAAAMLILSSQTATAGPAMKAARQACKADVAEHCTGIKPGAGRVACCLKQHESSLEQACKDALTPSKLYQKLHADCTSTGSNKPAGSSVGDPDPAARL